MDWRGREWSGGEGRAGQGRAGQGRVPDCLGRLSRVGISSRSTRPWNGQPPSILKENPKTSSAMDFILPPSDRHAAWYISSYGPVEQQ